MKTIPIASSTERRESAFPSHPSGGKTKERPMECEKGKAWKLLFEAIQRASDSDFSLGRYFHCAGWDEGRATSDGTKGF
ncbi:hypothetical protein [Sphingobacterium wenxiniae]|uniref:hypothetical protein n=1 Tax=Sphingobacterium wenxiniae TaxID=683125 RepID=UPI000B89B51A|nr:hypothetical protein [Sphingobacterium wenxiniae]